MANRLRHCCCSAGRPGHGPGYRVVGGTGKGAGEVEGRLLWTDRHWLMGVRVGRESRDRTGATLVVVVV